jgi:ParB family transcriptional regulator, chromosome partitioning protein
MSVRSKRPSPILGAASAMIDDEANALVTAAGRFHHSFEADVTAIEPDPAQSRKTFAKAEIVALAATMEERGQLQPILVRPYGPTRKRWMIVAGERRWRAAKLNGWPTILAIEHNGDPEVASLLENLQRIDLTPVEEARGIQRLIEGKGWTQNQAAGALGKSKGEVSGILGILTLPEDLLGAVLTSELAIPKHALVELARVEQVDEREHLIEVAKNGRLTVRMIRSVRDGENRKAAGAVDSLQATGIRTAKPLGAKFSFRALGKMTSRLREARQNGRILAPRETARLEALRAEIDHLLADSRKKK